MARMRENHAFRLQTSEPPQNALGCPEAAPRGAKPSGLNGKAVEDKLPYGPCPRVDGRPAGVVNGSQSKPIAANSRRNSRRSQMITTLVSRS